MRRKRTTCSAQIAIGFIGILLLPAFACAQDVTEPALKAAFIYNLAKFTEWPHEALAARPFIMCVVGDADVSDALERTVKNRRLAGNGITVVRVTSAAMQRNCHVLYLSRVTAEQATQSVVALRGTPVLTISDLTGFTELGGIAQFFFEHGQMRFSIGLEAANRASLQISAKILTLAIRK
jgi:hypothetical protein